MIDFRDIIAHSGAYLSIPDAECLYKTATELRPKSILEIGAMYGCSTSVLGQVAKACGGHLYTIEPNPRQEWKDNVARLGLGEYVTLIVGSSPWIDTQRIAQPIDYLCVDGAHQTRWCLADYHYFSPFVRRGGRIAFHDWCGAGGMQVEVRRAIEIILETDALSEVERAEGRDKGLIVFQKDF